MIVARALTKDYGDKRAVDGLGFTVRPGVVTGFLGPNGSGKSTTMRLILGLDAPTSGETTVNGKRYRDHAAPLHEVGALLEARSVHTGRSAYNHLLALAQTHGIPRSRVDELIDLVGLQDVARKRAGKFSLGMGQRLGIASALIGDPQTVMLDEPVNGLDPEGIHWMRNLLRGLAAEGRTVFVSSHLMSEMALTADHLIVVGRGRLIADMSTEAFLAAGLRQRRSRPLPSRRAAPGAARRPGRGRRRPRRRADRGARPDRRADRRRRGRAPDPPPRADAAAGLARGGVHGHHARRRRVQEPSNQPPVEVGRVTTVDRLNAPPRRSSAGRVTQLHVALSEWTKLRSVRSTRWSLLVAVVGTIGLAALACAVVAHHYPQMSASDRADFNPLDVNFVGVQLAQLAIGVLGVLVISGRVLDRDDPLVDVRRPQAAARPLGEGGRLRARDPRPDAPGDPDRVLRRTGVPLVRSTSTSRSPLPASAAQ